MKTQWTRWKRGLVVVLLDRTTTQQILLFLFGYVVFSGAQLISMWFAVSYTTVLFGIIFPWVFGLIDEIERARRS